MISSDTHDNAELLQFLVACTGLSVFLVFCVLLCWLSIDCHWLDCASRIGLLLDIICGTQPCDMDCSQIVADLSLWFVDSGISGFFLFSAVFVPVTHGGVSVLWLFTYVAVPPLHRAGPFAGVE